MNQVENSTIARPVPIQHHRLLTGAAVLVVAIAVATAAGLAIVSIPVKTVTAPSTPEQDAVDGWAPAMADRSAAKLAQIQDGYLPGLLGARNSGEAVDGWESSLVR
jgi:hypothetical protein